MKNLTEFLQASPTSWHAVEQICHILVKKGFTELDETKDWLIKPGHSYFLTRNGSSLIAFVMPKNDIISAHVSASHTDSPALKLKPQAAYRKENMLMLGVEIYGGPLLSSWLNRDLGIAGRIITLDKKGNVIEKVVNAEHAPVIIPQLAIHLDRDVNTVGLILNKQEHLAALAELKCQDDAAAKKYLNDLFKIETILSSDLFLYPLEPPKYLGPNNEMLAAYRLDSLSSVHAIVSGLCSSSKPSKHNLKMCAFWDNEEIGSETSHGAASPFFSETLERILYSLGRSRSDYLRLIPSSLCLSVDLAHAINPNYAEKHEPHHKVYLGKGIVIKHSAQHKYASNARTVGQIKALCKNYSIPYQEIVNRGDIPSGSTIGPIHAKHTGMPTVDIGISQLSMHSTREVIAIEDHKSMIALLTAFYSKD